MVTQRGEPGLSRAVEKQMRNWEYARLQRVEREALPGPGTQEFICLSRMVGIDGREIAERLGERLGWAVFDRQVLELMAGDDDVRRRLYETMDERDLKWWQAAMSPLVVGRFVSDDYFHRLCDAVLTLARQACCIFVGRGAELILPADLGLRVRLVAGLEWRVEGVAKGRELSREAARAWIEREEEERAGFFRRYFHALPTDPGRYDLAVNVERLSAAAAVELILAAQRVRAEPLALAAAAV